MYLRKVFVNIIVAFVIFPLFISIKYWGNILNGDYKYYDTNYQSLKEYLFVTIYHPLAYPLVPLLILFFIFMPFQLTKDYYSNKKKKLSYFSKVILLSAIVLLLIMVWGLFTNIWDIPWYNNLIYLFYALVFGFVFATLLYFTVDIHVEKKKKHNN